MPAPIEEVDVWSVEGTFGHLIYSPRGTIEGVLMIDAEGAANQFVLDPEDGDSAELLAGLREGRALVLEGVEASASHKGEAEHPVYMLERVASVAGKLVEAPAVAVHTVGKVIRFNYARHGERNGFVLDNGDFVHTRPKPMRNLDLQVGDAVRADGTAMPLATGSGRVIEAHAINGQAIE